jgi:hypothetical protein
VSSGQREIVVRAISDPLIRVPGVSGATDLGDGKVVLILDLPALAPAPAAPRRCAGPAASPTLRRETPEGGREGQLHRVQRRRHRLRGRSQQVAHVEMVEHITPVPNATDVIDGVVFSRGEIVPALNLRVRFGFPRIACDLRTRCWSSATTGGRRACWWMRRASSWPFLQRRSIPPTRDYAA